MDWIPVESVEKAYSTVCGMTEQEAYCLSSDFQKEQPLLVAYLTAVDQPILNQDERELLFYLGTVAWKIMSLQCQSLPASNEERLLSIESANQKLGKSLCESNSFKFADVVKKLLKECHQSEVLRYIIAALMDEDNADNAVRDENLGIIILNLKTVIEYLDNIRKHTDSE